ncbi:MAG: glucosamine-6-phosphate deaminase [Brevinemataceae bacterium]
MDIKILNNRKQIISTAAEEIVFCINSRKGQNERFVLGLSTGATVLSICEELVSYVERGAVSFKEVYIFYAGKYLGFSDCNQESYFQYMFDNFFSKIDIRAENIFFLNGYTKNIDKECVDYEQKILQLGGMDLFVGSIGENGNLAFNEPGSSLCSRTRVKTLSSETIKADARFFEDHVSLVPTQAATIGLGTICDARRVIISVYGVNKAFALKSCLEGSISIMYPASVLQKHEAALFLVDQVAARFLTLSLY